MTNPETTRRERARLILECADIFRRGCSNTLPPMPPPHDPLDCDACVIGFLAAIRKALKHAD
jgi:hypothetical protein